MKRTYAGVEHSVPMSLTWGNGDLKKPFFLQKDLLHNENKVWMSPGLMVAMDAVGAFEEKATLKAKTQKMHKLLQEAIPLLGKKDHIFITNAEELLLAMLLVRNGLTQGQVDDFLSRPKNMIQSGLMLHVPRTSKQLSAKGDACTTYLKEVEIAKTAFKALADNALLKAWEFSLASFSEINLDFARWNLYTSLGVNYDDPGGIGECLYSIISRKVEQANANLKELQEEYEQILAQCQYLEARARSASTEKEINWLKVEYQSRQTELYHIDQVRMTAHEKASKIANLYDFLMREYDKKFVDYFQEVYDADIHEISTGPFDDSPAGFRLLYKHGRSNPSLWTYIRTFSDYIESLVSFFTVTEQEFATAPPLKGIESELGHIVTQIVGHVRSDQFMESALWRMAKAHGSRLIAKPLENLDKVEKKPWVYTSGGSMSTLVSAYFRREEKPFEVSRWVENETELLAFIIDTVKQLPPTSSKLFSKGNNKSLLIHSPTHAFLLKPGFDLFYDAWKSDVYTYSWIKETIVEPARAFWQKSYLNEEMMRDLLAEISFTIFPDFRPRFRQLFQRLPYRLSVKDFRRYVLDTAYSDRGMHGPFGPQISSDEVDSIIYSHVPYILNDQVAENTTEVLSTIFANDASLFSKISEVVNSALKNMDVKGVISSKKLQGIIKAIAGLILNDTRMALDLHGKIIKELRLRNLVAPSPLIFADSNWVKDYFAFVVSPATIELELWSVDYYGTEGKPISHWKMWLNGAKREPKWGIFSKPQEYIG